MKKEHLELALALADMEREVKVRTLRSYDRLAHDLVDDPGIRKNLITLLEGLPAEKAVLLAGTMEALEGVRCAGRDTPRR